MSRLSGWPRRARDASRLNWRALSRSGRGAIAGVVAAALLAVGLGVLIPRTVEANLLEARREAIVSLVDALESRGLIPSVAEPLAGSELHAFDSVVRGGLLGGDNVRVKLWNPRGEVIYSDNADEIGDRFAIGPDLGAALAGHATAEHTDLAAAENDADADIGTRALEFYIPLNDGGGGPAIGAFEVYQDVGPFASRMARVRWVVWLAVGGGLAVLTVFLLLLFAGTAAAMARDERAAQERAEELEALLETSRVLNADLEAMTRARGEALGRLVEAQEDERRHLVGDLHDGLGQVLTRILYGLRGSRTHLDSDPEKVATELQHLEELTESQIRELRKYLTAIRPALLDEFGLRAAIESFARGMESESGLTVEVSVAEGLDVKGAEAVALFRALQEAAINVRKHADARSVQIRLGLENGSVVLEVQDDGRGPGDMRDGIGLTYLRDRVGSLGGRVEVSSVAAGGTRVMVTVPTGGARGID